MTQQTTPKAKMKKRTEIEVKLLSENAYTPVKAKRGSIGYDLTIPHDVVVPARSRIVVPLDLAINLPYGIEGKIEPRSGFSSKGIEGYGTRKKWLYKFGFIPYCKTTRGKMRFNADVIVGKVDPLYTESIGVIILNNDEEFTLRRGTRIAQISFYNTISPFFVYVESLNCDSRGGGFGSSGTTAAEVSSNSSPHLAPATKHG